MLLSIINCQTRVITLDKSISTINSHQIYTRSTPKDYLLVLEPPFIVITIPINIPAINPTIT